MGHDGPTGRLVNLSTMMNQFVARTVNLACRANCHSEAALKGTRKNLPASLLWLSVVSLRDGGIACWQSTEIGTARCALHNAFGRFFRP